MSLIEKYGSYEQAVKTLWQEQEEGYPGDDIARELLEYRRQHNIFEVGDKAVYLSNIAPEHDDIYELSKIGKMHHLLKIGAMDYNAKFNHIRHATDEEIKNNQRGS